MEAKTKTVARAINPLFTMGRINRTQGACALPMFEVARCLSKHVKGDWGIVGKDDAKENDLAVANDERILSAYMIGDVKIWIITEWSRETTTVLLPEEY